MNPPNPAPDETADAAVGSWLVGHLIVGHRPDTAATSTYAGWTQARDAYVEMARAYADTDDEQTGRWLGETAHPEDYPDRDNTGYGDDEPAMRATVDAILTDDPPAREREHRMWIADGQDQRIEFWLVRTDGPSPDPRAAPDPGAVTAAVASGPGRTPQEVQVAGLAAWTLAAERAGLAISAATHCWDQFSTDGPVEEDTTCGVATVAGRLNLVELTGSGTRVTARPLPVSRPATGGHQHNIDGRQRQTSSKCGGDPQLNCFLPRRE